MGSQRVKVGLREEAEPGGALSALPPVGTLGETQAPSEPVTSWAAAAPGGRIPEVRGPWEGGAVLPGLQ